MALTTFGAAALSPVNFLPLTRLPKPRQSNGMELEYTYWRSGPSFVGFLNDYPDDSTQGETREELEEALAEVYVIRREEKRRLAEIRKTGKIKVLA